MNVYEKEALRLVILKTIYELSGGIPHKHIRTEKINDVLSDTDKDLINGELLYLHDKNLIDGPDPLHSLGNDQGLIFDSYITTFGIDTIEHAIKGQATGDFSTNGIQIFVNSINGNNSNIIIQSSNVSIEQKDIETINAFIKLVKENVDLASEQNKNINSLIEIIVQLSNEKTKPSILKKLIDLLITIGGDILKSILTREIKEFLS